MIAIPGKTVAALDLSRRSASPKRTFVSAIVRIVDNGGANSTQGHHRSTDQIRAGGCLTL